MRVSRPIGESAVPPMPAGNAAIQVEFPRTAVGAGRDLHGLAEQRLSSGVLQIPAFAGMSAPTMARISAVQVRVGISHSPEAEGNCVAERRGGEQPEANLRSVVKRIRFGGMLRRACSFKVKPGRNRSR